MVCWVASSIRKLCAEALRGLLHYMANLIPPSCQQNHEAAGGEGGEGGRSLVPVAVAAVEMLQLWDGMIVAFCLSSAVAIATVSLQIERMLPRAFHVLSLALLLCFGCVAFGKLTCSIFCRVSQILYCLSGFLGVTALFVATAIPYAPYFRIVIFLIYVVFWFTFLLITLKASSCRTVTRHDIPISIASPCPRVEVSDKYARPPVSINQSI